MKTKQPTKNGANGRDKLRVLRTRALETERLAEVARKVMRFAKERFKAARAALKVAKKAAKAARKAAKAAAKELLDQSEKVGAQTDRKSKTLKQSKSRKPKAHRAPIAKNRCGSDVGGAV